jgi:hypothetical protein
MIQDFSQLPQVGSTLPSAGLLLHFTFPENARYILTSDLCEANENDNESERYKLRNDRKEVIEVSAPKVGWN